MRVIIVRLFSRDAVLGLAYQMGERKPKAICKEAHRAGPPPYQPDEVPVKAYRDPILKTGALDIERHRIRARQEEGPEIHPYIALLGQGMGELCKKYGPTTAELTNGRKDDYVQDGRWHPGPMGQSTGRWWTSRHSHSQRKHQVDQHQRT